MSTCVFAIVAHPDDIEFGMAGTLVLLTEAGCEIHAMNVASGSCGSVEHDAETITRIRDEEARNAVALIGATHHPPLVPDLDIFYDKEQLARLGSIIREVAPDILLIPSPQDYMEDHTNTSRLAVTAAFSRGMRNFPVDPPREPIDSDIALYHAQPHGHVDQLNQPIIPDFVVAIDSVIDQKEAMLAEHRSQKDWLDHSQGMDAYLITMRDLSRPMGDLVDECKYAEGWRRHSPMGFGPGDYDPLPELLKDYIRRV